MKFQFIFLIVCHASFCETDALFLKFGMMDRIPEFFLVNSSDGSNNTEFAGIWLNAIEWLSQRSKFRYEIIPIPDDIGNPQYLNGSGIWSGATGRLMKNDFDFVGPPVQLSRSRIRVVDYAGVAEDLKSALLTPPPTERSSILSTIRPFSPTVWLVVILSMLVIAIFFAITSSIANDRFQWKNLLSFYDYFFYTLAIMTSQGESFGQRDFQHRQSYRLAGAGFCLFAVVMVNLYSSTLTSHITTRKMNPVPDSSIQIVEEGLLDYLMLNQGLGREMILGATNGPLKKMGDVFRRKPENFIPDQETAFLKVASGCCAYSAYMSYLEFRTAKDFQKYGRCRVHIGKPISGYGFVGLLAKRSSPTNPNREMINKGVLEMYQAGLIEYWRREFIQGQASICKSQKNNKPSKLRQLNLKDLASGFFILGIGIGLSLMTFLGEQLSRYHRRSYI